MSKVLRPKSRSKGMLICFCTAAPRMSSSYGAAHPPYAKPSLLSSSGPPGPCMTPSREMCSSTMIFLMTEFLRVLTDFVQLSRYSRTAGQNSTCVQEIFSDDVISFNCRIRSCRNYCSGSCESAPASFHKKSGPRTARGDARRVDHVLRKVLTHFSKSSQFTRCPTTDRNYREAVLSDGPAPAAPGRSRYCQGV